MHELPCIIFVIPRISNKIVSQKDQATPLQDPHSLLLPSKRTMTRDNNANKACQDKAKSVQIIFGYIQIDEFCSHTSWYMQKCWNNCFIHKNVICSKQVFSSVAATSIQPRWIHHWLHVLHNFPNTILISMLPKPNSLQNNKESERCVCWNCCVSFNAPYSV